MAGANRDHTEVSGVCGCATLHGCLRMKYGYNGDKIVDST